MFEFANKYFMSLFLLIPIFIVIFIWSLRARKKALQRYGNLSVISQLIPERSFSRPVLKFILLALTLVFFVFTVMAPRFGTKIQEVKRQGGEIIIALDVSNSMLATDITPSRLLSARQSITRLVDKLDGDKIGLIIFAGQAYTQVPITTDYAAVKMFLQNVSTDLVPTQGTAIGAAIDLATRSFSPDTETDKTIIVITDGENHEDDAVEKAKEAVSKGIFVHTIGMGSEQGSPIPTGRPNEFRKDRSGQVIISRLNETMLAEVANAGNGVYVRAGNSRSSLDILFDEVDKMKGTEYEAKVFGEYEQQFQYFAAAALFFLLLDLLVLERRNKRMKNIKLFKIKI